LITALQTKGYTVIGPTIRDGAIVYDAISEVADLPVGMTDRQEAGSYRLVHRADDALFGYTVGPTSWKRYLFPPRSTLLTIESVDGHLTFSAPEPTRPRYAFLGVRACELAAIAIQDKVFLDSGRTDRTYFDRRHDLFTVAVNCGVAGNTCFCASMGTGPECTTGFDLVLTEIIEDDRHEFVAAAGSDDGEQILAALEGREALEVDLDRVAATVATATSLMGRTLDTTSIKEVLYASRDSDHWGNVAERCLACTNCTLVCPTCFCSTTEDTASLDASTATRQRRWDSCFALDFTSLHGTPVRHSTAARYRQWLTHKLASWQDQFGTSGCVGCGRCITWCPVGIDITAEAAAIRDKWEVPV
jgi:ferredoxin